MNRHFRYLSLAAVIITATVSAPAQNLVVNPHFDADLSGWSAVSGVASFDPTMDAKDSTLSGSVRGNRSGDIRVLKQCITGVTQGQLYSFGGMVFIHQGSSEHNLQAMIYLEWFTDYQCSQRFGTMGTKPVVTMGRWEPLVGRGVGVPSGVVAASIAAVLYTDGGHQVVSNFDNDFHFEGGEPAVANFDDLYLVQGELPTPTPLPSTTPIP